MEEERNEKKAFKKSFRLFSRDMQERQKNNTIKCHLWVPTRDQLEVQFIVRLQIQKMKQNMIWS